MLNSFVKLIGVCFIKLHVVFIFIRTMFVCYMYIIITSLSHDLYGTMFEANKRAKQSSCFRSIDCSSMLCLPVIVSSVSQGTD